MAQRNLFKAGKKKKKKEKQFHELNLGLLQWTDTLFVCIFNHKAFFGNLGKKIGTSRTDFLKQKTKK